MALTSNTAARNLMADALAARLAGGTLLIQAGADNTIGTGQLATPAFGAAVDGVLTIRDVPEIIMAKAGTADRFILRSADGVVQLSGTITQAAGGGDIITTRPNFTVGEGLKLTAFPLTVVETV